MTLSIKGHHCELKESTKAYVERKLRKIQKATRNLGSIEVKLSEERKGLIDAEIRVVADKGVWVEANFKETDLTHVVPGEKVTVTVDTYPSRTWHGRVESISQATGAVFSVIPPQNATGNWVKVVQRIPVRIALDDTAGAPPLRAGMSTEVEIDTGSRHRLTHLAEAILPWMDKAQAKQPELVGSRP